MILDVVAEPVEDISIGQTLRCSPLTEQLAELQKHVKQDDRSPNFKPSLESGVFGEIVPKVIADQSNFYVFT